MKKITLGCSVLLAAILLFPGCNKKTNPEPEQDKEFQSSKDVAFANSVAIDIEQIAAYLGEGQGLTGFFAVAPGSAGVITPTVIGSNTLMVTYSGSVTCRDGKKRDGTIIVSYSSSPTSYSANAMRDPGFLCDIYLNNYWVDGWKVDDVTPLRVHNTTAFNYVPSATKLTWKIEGELSLENVAEPSKNMTWKGSLIKTLANSTLPTVLNPGKLFPIAWGTSSATPGAVIEYSGIPDKKEADVTGVTSVSKPYSFKIDVENPLVVQYSCSPDKVLGVVTGTTIPVTVTPIYSEWHPFVKGVAQFTTSGLPQVRKIDFSSDGNADCDNAGKVTIKGIDYPLDFMK